MNNQDLRSMLTTILKHILQFTHINHMPNLLRLVIDAIDNSIKLQGFIQRLKHTIVII